MNRIYIITGLILLITSIIHVLLMKTVESFQNAKKKEPLEQAEDMYVELRKLRDTVEKEYSDALLSWRAAGEKPTDKTKNIIITLPKLTYQAQQKANKIHDLIPNTPLSMKGQDTVNEIIDYNNKIQNFVLK
jgi:hypothetical protein